MKGKLWTVLAVMVILSVGLAACGPKPTEAPATKAPEAAPAKFECTDKVGCIDIGPQDPIRIAYMFVVSGPDASLGTDTKRGAEMAFEDKKEVLGHAVELIGEDSLCSAEVSGLKRFSMARLSSVATYFLSRSD